MRIIPDDNLAYPVLIRWNNGSSGSGFRLRVDNKTYLITAKHVLYNNENNLLGNNLTLLCQTGDIDDDSTYELEVDMKKLEKNGLTFFHPNYDLAAFLETTNDVKEDGSYTADTVDGIIIKRQGRSKIISVNHKTGVALLDKVMISNDIYLYGYPSSLGLKEMPQFDYTKPLLRKGIVASINKNQGTVILDCPVYYGNSGGPVVQIEQVLKTDLINEHKIIGVVTQFIPYSENWKNMSNNLIHQEWSNSGYSVAVAIDYVFEMLNIK